MRAGQLAQAEAVGGGQVGGQQMRHQPCPLRPGDGIGRVAGVVGGQDRLGAGAGGGGLGRGETVAENGLGEFVHLQSAVIDAGQRLPGQMGQGLVPRQRVGGAGGQLPRQFAGGGSDQLFRDRGRSEESAEARQLGSGRVLASEPVRD